MQVYCMHLNRSICMSLSRNIFVCILFGLLFSFVARKDVAACDKGKKKAKSNTFKVVFDLSLLQATLEM